ncbi:MAG: hypothetical protein WDW36_008243 [Sanguina aurantia]
MAKVHSDEERAAAAKQLSIDPSDLKMMMLVEDMMKDTSLPAHWKAHFDSPTQKWVYTRNGTGQTMNEHPSLDYYRGAVFMDRGGYRVLMRNMADHHPTPPEVQAMCGYFDINGKEDKYVVEVAELACSAPLPNGWEEFTEEASGDTKYRCECERETHAAAARGN